MKTLDLHGLRHHEVEGVVENFVLIEELPVKIITGNSVSMQLIVRDVIKRHDLHWDYESFYNLGAIVVVDNPI